MVRWSVAFAGPVGGRASRVMAENMKTTVVRSVDEMRSMAESLSSAGHKVGFVPTMGYFHRGHLSLIESAREKADKVVVSLFVNPMQFGPNEDFHRYPQDFESDLAACEKAGVDILFCPPESEMYPPGYSTYIDEERYSRHLCGVSRPHHFRGVLTVVAKLFNIVRPDFAVFGQKDAQQAAVIRKMVADLHFPVEIVVNPTVREDDGLAMSSRNTYLSSGQREDAAVINKALVRAREMVQKGTVNPDRVKAEVTNLLSTRRRVRVIYVEIVDPRTMEPRKEIVPGESLLAVAVWVDEVRLIDNTPL
jgi:pantoate--beta-alanine ligase